MTKKKLKFSIYSSIVGNRIKSIRLLQNKTLEEWGKIFGASKGNVLLWEQGKTLPNKKRLEKIAELGNTTINKLLYGNCEEFLDLNFIIPKFGIMIFVVFNFIFVISKNRYLGILLLNL